MESFHRWRYEEKGFTICCSNSWASVTKLSKGETVSMEVLMKICKTLECNIGDIMDLIPKENEDNQ